MADGAQWPAPPDPVIDLKFLDRYTGGDDQVRDQILALYLDQSRLLYERLSDALGDRKAWHDAAHSLKGCARGIGAHTVADLAYKAERAAGAGAMVEAALLTEIDSAISATGDVIRELIKAA